MSSIYGYNQIGASTVQTGVPNWCKFTTPADMDKITAIYAYFNPQGVGVQFVTGIAYNNAGSPGNVIQQTSPSVAANGASWKSQLITQALLPNTVYWIALFVNTNNTIAYYDAGSTNQRATKGPYDGWPVIPSSPTGIAWSARKQSLYALYTPIVSTSPNRTSRKNFNGYLAFVQQFFKHKMAGTTPWASPNGNLMP